MMCLLRRLRAERRGVATVEFSLWSVVILAVLLIGLDIGAFLTQRARLGEAIAGASVSAFRNRAAVAYANLPGFVQAASATTGGQSVTVSVTCNGTNTCVNGTPRTCACLSRTGTYTAAAACGAACTGATANSTSGYYMKVEGSYSYRSTTGLMRGAVVRQSSVVRLQ